MGYAEHEQLGRSHIASPLRPQYTHQKKYARLGKPDATRTPRKKTHTWGKPDAIQLRPYAPWKNRKEKDTLRSREIPHKRSYYVCKRKARRDGWSRPLPQGAPRPMNFKREK